MGQLDKIDHIVVLMLESRSFDSMLGKLYPQSSKFDGLSGTESNLDGNGTSIRVWHSPGTDEGAMRIPNPDPGELWTDINMQLFGAGSPPPTPTATTEGFVKNYVSQTAEPAANYVANNIMHYFAPEQVPVISTLAREFAVSDRSGAGLWSDGGTR
jgi:phospholipase C